MADWTYVGRCDEIPLLAVKPPVVEELSSAARRRRVLRRLAVTGLILPITAAASGLIGPTSLAAAGTSSIERPSIMQMQDRAHQPATTPLPADPTIAGRSLAARRPAATGAPTAKAGTTYNNAGLQKEVFGFAPYWALGGGTLSDVQWDKISTVSYFGLTLNGGGGFVNDAGMTGWNSAALSSMINSARAQGDRVQVTVKSFSDSTIYPVVNDPVTAQTAINNIIAMIKTRGLDGVNIDFEGTASPSYPGIQAKFSGWVGALRAQMRSAVPGALLSLDAYSGSASWNAGFMRIDALAPNVDAFFIMAYDMTQPSDLPNAPLQGAYTYTDTTSVDQFVSKSGDPMKVILGVPYYGYKFSTANASFGAPVTSAAGAVAYSDIQSDVQCASGAPDNLTYHWDSGSSTPWLSWFSPSTGDPCQGNHGSWRETYFDDYASLAAKYDLVNSRGIRGAGIWALGNDHGYTELWRAIRDHLGGDWWAGWYPLGGAIAGRIAVGTNNDGRLEAFGRTSSGTLAHAWQIAPSGAWTPAWGPLGGNLASDPTAVTNRDGRLEVFATGVDGHLYHAWQLAPGGAWTGFYSLGGALTGRPATVANGDGRLEVFARGVDGATWHIWQVSPGGSWGPPVSFGDHSTMEPSATRNPDGRLEAFARGGDGALWHSWQISPGAGWTGWYSLGGSLTGNPSVTTNFDGRLEVFTFGTDKAIWHAWQNTVSGSWTPFVSLGSAAGSEPTAARNADGRLEVFAVEARGQVDHTWQVSRGGAWVSWRALSGFSATSPVGVGVNGDGRLELLAQATDLSAWHNWQVVPNGG